jgi:hypothetical protein
MVTFTYLLKSNGLYKIGKSKDPHKRLSQIKTGNPDVQLITYGTGSSESYLHTLFAKNRVSGEWFKFDEKKLVECISLIKDGSRLYIPKKQESQRYLNRIVWKVPFGKYKDREIRTMTSNEEIRYLKWFVKVAENKKTVTYKNIKWWLKELGEIKSRKKAYI